MELPNKLAPDGVDGVSRGRSREPDLATDDGWGVLARTGAGLFEGALVRGGAAARSGSAGMVEVRGVTRRCFRANWAEAVMRMTSEAAAG